MDRGAADRLQASCTKQLELRGTIIYVRMLDIPKLKCAIINAEMGSGPYRGEYKRVLKILRNMA